MNKWLPLVYLGVLGVILYGAYKLFFSNGAPLGAGAPDPGGGAPATGVLSAIINSTTEIGSSPLSMSDALQQTFSDPLGVMSSILGLQQDTGDSSGANDGEGGQ